MPLQTCSVQLSINLDSSGKWKDFILSNTIKMKGQQCKSQTKSQLTAVKPALYES